MPDQARRSVAKHLLTATVLKAVAVVGGVAGAFLAWWAQGQETENVGILAGLLGTAVAVAGWYQSSRLSADAQRRLLHLQLLNEARHILVVAFRSEQDRLGRIHDLLSPLQSSETMTSGTRTQALSWLADESDKQAGLEWVAALEEYWALFPEIANFHRQLLLRQAKLQRECYELKLRLMQSEQQHPAFHTKARDLLPHIEEQSALLTDLRLHVQDRALGGVSGNPAPRRIAPNDRVPRLAVDEAGHLALIVPDGARRSELQAEGWLEKSD